MVTLPSSFSGGIQSAVESIKRGQLPQSVTSPVVNPAQVKQTTKLPVKKTGYVPLTREQFMKAQSSGFTPDQIIEMEKRRKSEMEGTTKAPQPKAPMFQDRRPEEGIIGQTLKALPRAAYETGKQVVGNIQGAFESGSNVLQSGLSSAYKGVTGRQLPGFGTAESGFTEQKQKFDVPSNLAQFGASATGLATQATPVGLATNVGFNLASELPGVQYAPQAIGAGIQGASNIVSDVTGISPEITNNLTTTALNTLFLRSAGKQSAPISQAYAKSGQLGALKELGMSVPRTTVDIAKQPIQAVIGTAKIPFKIADWAIGKTAQGLLTNKTGTQELFQASSPSINKIGNKSLGLDKLREKSAIADETVVKLGYRPKNTTERAEAYQSAMGDIWNQIEQVRGGVSEKFSGRQLGDIIRDRIQKAKVNGKLSPSQQKDANTLNDWATYYDSLGEIDMPKLAASRTQINGETTWNKKLDNGDLFNKTFQDLAAVVRKTENNVIDSAKGGKFQDLMSRYGALATLLEDVIKQDVKAQRAKGEGLTTTYSRIEGIGDVLKGGIGLVKEPVTGLSNIASGLGKLAVGKTLAKLKDTDFLIENGYNKLYKSLGLEKGKGKLPTKKVYQEAEGLSPIQESSNIPMSSQINNTQKEVSKATLPKVGQKQTEVSKSVLPQKKVNNPIIQKLPKKQGAPKSQKEIQSLENEIKLKEQFIESLGNRPKGSIASDEYTRQVGEMGALKDRLDYLKAKTPQVEGKTVDKIKAMQLEQEDMIRNGETITEEFRNKWNDLQTQYKKEFIDSRIASERKKVDSAIRDIETKIKENPDRADWGRKQIQMEEEGFNNLKKGDYFEKKYQEHISKIREEAKKSSLLKSVKNKPSLPLSQKSEVKYSEPIEDNLVKEARKYKSAEEFVKAQGEPLYHGTDRVFDKFDLSKIPENEQGLYGRGIYVSPNKEFTEKYGKNNIEILIDKKANLFDWDTKLPATKINQLKGTLKDKFNVDSDTLNHIFSIPGKPINLYKRMQDILEISPKKVSDIFSESGIHGITVSKNGKLHEISIFDDAKIKTKQQLLDIYNKANKK